MKWLAVAWVTVALLFGLGMGGVALAAGQSAGAASALLGGQDTPAVPDVTGSTTAAATGGPAGSLNGQLDEALLCPLTFHPGQRLRCDAAAGFNALTVAYAERFGTRICITDTYRDLAGQRAVFAARPHLAAKPGRSNHGWGVAVDLCGGIERFGTPQHRWMIGNSPRYGWHQPSWARVTGSRPEAWHHEFGT